MTAYVAAIIGWFVFAGIELDKKFVVLAIVGALGLSCVGRSWADVRLLLLAWIPFLGALLVYDTARALAHELGRDPVVMPQANADKIFGGAVPTVWLQDHFYDPDRVHWYDVVATLVYLSHFFGAFALAGWLWARDRAAWVTFATRFFVLCFAAAVTFAIVPTAPPWAASEFGDIGAVTRIASHGWSAFGIDAPEVLLQQGRQMTNPYAAIPSLHAGWALLIAITLWRRVPSFVQPLLAAYAVAMGLTLVYTGEHYVVDILIGWAYVAGAVAVQRPLWARAWPRLQPMVNLAASSTSVARQSRGAVTGSQRAGAPPGMETT
jgi:hypothetical protein